MISDSGEEDPAEDSSDKGEDDEEDSNSALGSPVDELSVSETILASKGAGTIVGLTSASEQDSPEFSCFGELLAKLWQMA